MHFSHILFLYILKEIFWRFSGDSELTRILKFLKRAVETFGRNHALQLTLSSETGARVLDESGSYRDYQRLIVNQ